MSGAESTRDHALDALLTAEGRGALVVIDVQRDFGDPAFIGSFGLTPAASAAVAAAVTRTAQLVADARAQGVPVLWVELASDPAQAWTSSNWRAGKPALELPGADYPCVTGTPGAEWYEVAPDAGELVVSKTRYSGFYGTDLEAHLRSQGIAWLAMAGLTTECCVATTAFDAFQRGFPVVVASDATAAYDLDVHDAALRQLSDNAAVVATADEISQLWHAAAAEWSKAS